MSVSYKPEVLPPENSEQDTLIRRMERVGVVLDSVVSVPHTSIKLGVDSIVGLVPVVGDFFSAGLGCYVLYGAARLGVRKRTLLAMVKNLLLDLCLGLIPIVGDIADVLFRSNQKNVSLALAEVKSRSLTVRSHRSLGKAMLGVFIAIAVVTAMIPVIFVVLLLKLLL